MEFLVVHEDLQLDDDDIQRENNVEWRTLRLWSVEASYDGAEDSYYLPPTIPARSGLGKFFLRRSSNISKFPSLWIEQKGGAES